MEKVSDFFSELKERISNPFIFSFIIAWCLCNYEIIVGLIFYKNEDLKKDGYNSYLDLIRSHESVGYFVLLPLAWALFYTFGFPYFKNFIIEFGVKLDTASDEKNRKVSKARTVSIERFLEQEHKYNEALQKVANHLDGEGQLRSKINELEVSLRESNAANISNVQKVDTLSSRIQNQSEEWHKRQTTDSLLGDWTFKLSRNGITINTGYINIVQQSMMMRDKDGVIIHNYIITDVIANQLKIVIIFIETGPEKKPQIWILSRHEAGRVFYGTNQKDESIELTRRAVDSGF